MPSDNVNTIKKVENFKKGNDKYATELNTRVPSPEFSIYKNK